MEFSASVGLSESMFECFIGPVVFLGLFSLGDHITGTHSLSQVWKLEV